MRAAGLHVKDIARRLGVGTAIIYRVTRQAEVSRGKWERLPLDKRVMQRIDVRGPEQCWPWQGSRNSFGYGVILPNGSDKVLRVHRVVYELFVGAIPDGYDIDHVCHNADPHCPGALACEHRRCCNPAHLEPVTRSENLRRAAARRRLQKARS